MQDEGDKVIVCERGDLVFVFNFNPSQSFTDYGVGCKNPGSYKVGSAQLTGFACAHKIASCCKTPVCTYTEHGTLRLYTHHYVQNSHALHQHAASSSNIYYQAAWLFQYQRLISRQWVPMLCMCACNHASHGDMRGCMSHACTDGSI